MPPVLRELLLYTVAGVGTALALLAIPRPVLHRLARVPGLSPNWLSLWGVPLTLGGVYLLVEGVSFLGFMSALTGLMLDRIDGKMATGLPPFVPAEGTKGLARHWAELNHPGPTDMGKWLDALTDKIKLLPPLVWLAWRGDLSGWAVGCMVGTDLISIVMRPPVQLFPERWLRGAAATGMGKLKMVAQAMALLFVMPYYLGWFQGPLVPSNALLWVAFTFGVLSVLSRIKLPGERANRVVDKLTFTDPFRHDR